MKPMNEIQVLAIGTDVTIDGDIPATIRAVTIYSETWIKYLCVWWDERTRKEEWLTADEIQTAVRADRTVRFTKP